MRYFYDLNDAFIYLKKIKIYKLICIFSLLFILAITIPLTIIFNNRLVMILDIILYSSYFIYLDIYLNFIKKYYQLRYHFLAKINHYDKEFCSFNNLTIDTFKSTFDFIPYYKVTLDNDRVLYVENKLIDNVKNINNNAFIVIDNFIVGVIDDE